MSLHVLIGLCLLGWVLLWRVAWLTLCLGVVCLWFVCWFDLFLLFGVCYCVLWRFGLLSVVGLVVYCGSGCVCVVGF